MKIVITGASSGIGAALARAYAAPGHTLALTGRDETRLAAVADACRKSGAEVEIAALDVTDRAALANWLEASDTRQPIDLLIANAGISAGTGEAGETVAQAEKIFAVNLAGLLNTLHPIIPRMQQRGRGQIALMASLAGLRGLPTAPAYSASKGAVRLYGEGLREALAPFGISVSVICPGFIRTPMTAVNKFPMPFLMEVNEAARRMKSGLARKKARIAFPGPLYAAVWLLAALPVSWGDCLLRRLPGKTSDDSNKM